MKKIKYEIILRVLLFGWTILFGTFCLILIPLSLFFPDYTMDLISLIGKSLSKYMNKEEPEEKPKTYTTTFEWDAMGINEKSELFSKLNQIKNCTSFQVDSLGNVTRVDAPPRTKQQIKKELDLAVEKEDFEEAAILRDELKTNHEN